MQNYDSMTFTRDNFQLWNCRF